MTREEAKRQTDAAMKMLRPFVLDKAVSFVMDLTPEERRDPARLAKAVTEFSLTHASAAMLGTLTAGGER